MKRGRRSEGGKEGDWGRKKGGGHLSSSQREEKKYLLGFPRGVPGER